MSLSWTGSKDFFPTYQQPPPPLPPKKIQGQYGKHYLAEENNFKVDLNETDCYQCRQNWLSMHDFLAVMVSL